MESKNLFDTNSFIVDLESLFEEHVRKEGMNSKSYNYYCPISLRLNNIKHDYFECKHFILTNKEHRTQILYTKGGVRVYFSDVDIMETLLQIKEKETRQLIISTMINWINGEYDQAVFELNEKEYIFNALTLRNTKDIILNNKYDVELSIQNMIAIINAIISKDQACTCLYGGTINFAKRTLKKYCLLLQWHWSKNENIKNLLKSINYDINKSLRDNFMSNKQRKSFSKACETVHVENWIIM